jgi:hypothetical protein
MLESIYLKILLAAFGAWTNRQQARIITYLIEENRVLKEQLESGGRRLRFTDDQRRRLAAKGKPLGREVRREVRECLDQMIFLGRASLDLAIAEYVAHYHEERAHQGLGNELISGREAESQGNVVARERLGGLLKYYHREAA